MPGWACYLCALGLFIYQSLDAIDGKQARRTGTSSPLGELFDHGCDSISTGKKVGNSIQLVFIHWSLINCSVFGFFSLCILGSLCGLSTRNGTKVDVSSVFLCHYAFLLCTLANLCIW